MSLFNKERLRLVEDVLVSKDSWYRFELQENVGLIFTEWSRLDFFSNLEEAEIAYQNVIKERAGERFKTLKTWP